MEDVYKGPRDAAGLAELWIRYESVESLDESAFAAAERGDDAAAARKGELAARMRARAAVPSHLEALAISVHLENELHNARFEVVRRAVEVDRATWSQIGRILGMTKQSAHAWYRRQHRKPAIPNPSTHQT